MKLGQLRYVVEIVRHGHSLSAAADALGVKQPGISREIHLLEEELGFEIFERSRNRIYGLTEAGNTVFTIAQRIAGHITALQVLNDDIARRDSGILTIAATRMPSSYILPPVIRRFVAAFPKVQLVLKQGEPDDIAGMVESGDADVAIGTDPDVEVRNLVRLPCFDIPWCVVAPIGHPVLSVDTLTAEEIARYPMIGYYSRHDDRRPVWRTFAERGITPNIVMSGVDPDISKTYIRMGLGIGVHAAFTFDPERDKGLEARDAGGIFPPGSVIALIRPSLYLHPYLLDLMRWIAPTLTAARIRRAIEEFSA